MSLDFSGVFATSCFKHDRKNQKGIHNLVKTSKMKRFPETANS